MFRNFLILAYRNFKRTPLSSFIELFGMTAGFTVFVLILLWVLHETSYDKFNEKADRIYRLERVDTDSNLTASLPTIIAPILDENFPEIEEIVRFRPFEDRSKIYTINKNMSRAYYETDKRLFVDHNFFEMFTFEFIAGDYKTALTEKNTVVITESLAKTVFGDVNAMGQTIFNEEHESLRVTGIIKDVYNFHVEFTMLRSFVSLEDFYKSVGFKGLDIWELPLHYAYVLVKPNQDIRELEMKMSSVLNSHRPDKFKKLNPKFECKLRPLTDIYLNSNNVKEAHHVVRGDRKKLIAYSTIAIFMILLAIINFINLNSAKSLERAKEVGIKKVVGATRLSIFIQFLGEGIILCVFALILALALSYILLPQFNSLLDSNISINQLFHPLFLGSILLGLTLISLVSGGFPALFLSSFKPAYVIKGLPVSTGKKNSFKKLNLSIQFAVTIVLIIGSITVFQQIEYMKNADLGMDKNHKLVFSFSSERFRDKIEVLKRALLSNPKVHHVSHSSSIPGAGGNIDYGTVEFDGIEQRMAFARLDYDYQKTIDLELVEGRFFEKSRANDFYSYFNVKTSQRVTNILLNESAVKTMNLKTPIDDFGKVKLFDKEFDVKVIGVLKDFHLDGLNKPIVPVFYIWTDLNFVMMVDISSSNMASTVAFVKSEVENITKGEAEIKFLDNIYNAQYSGDENFSKLISYFTMLAILIACMGLFGVATHTIKLRLKEIGIRKTLGASSWIILKLITFYFLKILLVSILIAVPTAWLIMDNWLSNYAYRIELTAWVFIVGCVLTIVIAILTILYKSWQASNLNPVKLIKYE